MTLSVTASGSPGLSYQWQQLSGIVWSNIGLNQNTYNTGSLAATTVYRVVVYALDSGCEEQVSDEITVLVTDDIEITSIANNGTICTGGTWTLNVVATGSPALLYQWQDSTALGTWQNVSEPGGTTASFVSDPLTQTTYYRVFVHATQSGCDDIYSSTVTVTVVNDISITGLGAGGSICVGGTWNLSVTATGSPNLLYQWQDSIAAGTWQNVSEAGGTTASFTSDPLNTTTYYRAFVHAVESGCDDVFSNTVTVLVFPDISITGISASGSICEGGTWDLTVNASGSPNILYQWQDSTAAGSWQNVSEAGGTTSAFTSDALTQTTYYRVFVYANENGCDDIFSNVVTVNVFDDIEITGLSAGGSICVGGVWSLNVNATGAPNLLYQWQDSTAAGTWQNVSETGGNTSAFITDALNQTTYYRVFVSANESGCQDIFSSVVTVTVFNDIVITGISNGGSICVGGTWNLSLNATGAPAILYQWQDSTAAGVWQNVSEAGGTTSGFTTEALTQTTYYRAFVYATENGCDDMFSSVVVVNVYEDIQITGMSSGGSICESGTWNLSVEASGSPNILYQWQDSTA